MDTQEKKQYEISFLVKGDEGTRAFMSNLARFGAEILNEGEVKEIRLAYPIERNTTAYFGYVHANLSPETVQELTKVLELDKSVIRFLILASVGFDDKKEYAGKDIQRKERRARSDTRGVQAPKIQHETGALSNELLEEKLEEILK